MADKTYGFKVNEDFYDKAKLIIETSGISNKEWFERAVALYEMNSIKEGASDYKQDLTELEHHTTRMYELIVNMIQRSVYLKDHAVKEVADKLESKERVISDLQQQVQQDKQELLLKSEVIEDLSSKVAEIEGMLTANQTMLGNNQALISEYKDKNDTLNGLVTKYQMFATENEEIKQAFELEKAEFLNQATIEKTTFENQVNGLTEQVRTLSDNLRTSQQELEQTKLNNERNTTILIEKKELEKERAVVEVKAFHNEEVRKLYDEIANLRKAHEDMKEQLQTEIASLIIKDK